MAESNNGGPVSKVQIDELQKETDALNTQRPKPEQTLEYTPSGPETKYVMEEAAQQRNAEIDRSVAVREEETARMQQWLNERSGQATRDFNQERER